MPVIKKCQGAALITAIMITAVVATLAAAIMQSQSLLIQQAVMVQKSDQFYHMLLVEEVVAQQQLLSDWAKNKGKLYNESFDIHPVTIDGLKFSGHVVDATRYFNVNAVADDSAIPSFTSLIAQVTGMQKTSAMAVANATYEWVKKNGDAGSYGRLTPAYQAAHTLMANATEMRLIAGVDATTMVKLYPYIVALAKKTKININTALKPVVLSLIPKKQASSDNLQRILNCRKNAVIKNSKDLNKCLASASTAAIKLNTKMIDYSSRYFVMIGSVVWQHHEHKVFALFYLKPHSKKQGQTTSQIVTESSKKTVTLYWPKVEVLWQRW